MSSEIVVSGSMKVAGTSMETGAVSVSIAVPGVTGYCLLAMLYGKDTLDATFNGVALTSIYTSAANRLKVMYMANPPAGTYTLFATTAYLAYYLISGAESIEYAGVKSRLPLFSSPVGVSVAANAGSDMYIDLAFVEPFEASTTVEPSLSTYGGRTTVTEREGKFTGFTEVTKANSSYLRSANDETIQWNAYRVRTTSPSDINHTYFGMVVARVIPIAFPKRCQAYFLS